MEIKNIERYLKVFFGISKPMQPIEKQKKVGFIIDAKSASEKTKKEKELSHKRHIELQLSIIKHHIEKSIQYGINFTTVEMRVLIEVESELENLGYEVRKYTGEGDKQVLSINWE